MFETSRGHAILVSTYLIQFQTRFVMRQDLLRLEEVIETVGDEVVESMESLTKQLRILSSQLSNEKVGCFSSHLPSTAITYELQSTTPILSLEHPLYKHPGYPWEANSCWLDSALQIIYMTVKPDWNAFATCATTERNVGLHQLYEILARRRAQEDIDSLRLQRNEFRTYLRESRIIQTDAFLPAFVCNFIFCAYMALCS